MRGFYLVIMDENLELVKKLTMVIQKIHCCFFDEIVLVNIKAR